MFSCKDTKVVASEVIFIVRHILFSLMCLLANLNWRITTYYD